MSTVFSERIADVPKSFIREILKVAVNPEYIFWNPFGITYSAEKREKISKLIAESNVFIIEDDPYGELRYIGSNINSFKHYRLDKTILLGSFSKIVAPSFFYISKEGLNTLRLNFSCSSEEMIENGIRNLGEAINELLTVKKQRR